MIRRLSYSLIKLDVSWSDAAGTRRYCATLRKVPGDTRVDWVRIESPRSFTFSYCCRVRGNAGCWWPDERSELASTRGFNTPKAGGESSAGGAYPSLLN
jgi:hypothetical protein